MCREFEGVKIKLASTSRNESTTSPYSTRLCSHQINETPRSREKERQKESKSGCSDTRNDLEDKEWGKDTNMCRYLLTV